MRPARNCKALRDELEAGGVKEAALDAASVVDESAIALDGGTCRSCLDASVLAACNIPPNVRRRTFPSSGAYNLRPIVSR